MSYCEHRPSAQLEPLVECWWTHDAREAGQRVLPDGCIDVLFDVGSRPRAFVVGAMTRARVSDPHGEIVAVRFRPGAAPAVLGVDARSLRDLHVDLSDVWGRAGIELLERAAQCRDERARIELLDRALSARAREQGAPDRRVRRAVTLLLEPTADDEPRVARHVARAVGWSERQLERAFDRWVGVGPKMLARIARLSRVQQAIDRGDPGRSGWAAVALDLGYCDQAHLARDIAALTGVPPTVLERERAAMRMSVSSKTEPAAAPTVAA